MGRQAWTSRKKGRKVMDGWPARDGGFTKRPSQILDGHGSTRLCACLVRRVSTFVTDFIHPHNITRNMLMRNPLRMMVVACLGPVLRLSLQGRGKGSAGMDRMRSMGAQCLGTFGVPISVAGVQERRTQETCSVQERAWVGGLGRRVTYIVPDFFPVLPFTNQHP